MAELPLPALISSRHVVQLSNEYLEYGTSFTQESTLSGRRIKEMAKTARANGFHVRLFYIGLDSAEESMIRIANRVRKGGHDIDADTVVYRYNRRFSDIAEMLPLCDEAEFYDNENGFHLVGHYEDKTLIVYKKNPPEWISELDSYLTENH